MSFDTGIKHTFWAGPWHNCSICDRKTKVAELQWQRGKLKCPRCYEDWPLLGQREIGISEVLGDDAEELAPVQKIREPSSFETADDFNL